MPKGIIFWVLMLLVLIGTGWSAWGEQVPRQVTIGNSLVLFVLLFLLGWQVFGFIVQ